MGSKALLELEEGLSMGDESQKLEGQHGWRQPTWLDHICLHWGGLGLNVGKYGIYGAFGQELI